MKFLFGVFIGIEVLAVVALGGLAASSQSKRTTATGGRLAALNPIDAHAHIFNPSSAIVGMLERLNVRILNVCVVDKYERGYEEAEHQNAMALRLFLAGRDRMPWCSTFDPQKWEREGFAARAIAQVEQSFRDGAIAVKIYKSIGMDLKSRSGAYLMPDDPVFDPIFKVIAERNHTLYAHIAEPIAAWQALDPASPDYGYYKASLAWHMYGHPERPSKEAILAARDRMLLRHPGLRVVGCHLGSMEEDVAEIAKRLDRYPNFVVDTAARITHLMIQPREKVRAFLIRYQDRVLYGTDLVLQSWENVDQSIRHWESEYDRDYRFLATDEVIKQYGRQIRGLALPEPVLRKLYHDNAVRWVPGITLPKH